jgi:hypothetical protein
MNDDQMSAAPADHKPARPFHDHPEGPTVQRLRRELKEHATKQSGVRDSLLVHLTKPTAHPVTEGMAIALIAAWHDLNYPLHEEAWQPFATAASKGEYNERTQVAIDLVNAHLVKIEYGKAAIEIMDVFGAPTEPAWSNLFVWEILPELNNRAKTIAGRVNDPRAR